MGVNLEQFKSCAIYKDAINDKLSHSLILLSRDEYAIKRYTDFLVLTLMCENTEQPCGVCDKCQKVLHQNCVDVLYYPKNNKTINVAEINDLIEETYTAPYESNKKIFVLKNANNIDAIVQNKLLKTLEEPPHNTYFILEATEDNNILSTIKSRCRKIQVSNFENTEITSILKENNIDDNTISAVLLFCDNNCSLALNYAQNPNFVDMVNLVIDIFKNFRQSSQMLDYSAKLLEYNENFEEILDIFLNIIDRTFKLISGQNTGDKLATFVAQNFSVDALIELNKVCLNLVEKRRRYCNFSGIVDNFLFMILEVRHKWPIM